METTLGYSVCVAYSVPESGKDFFFLSKTEPKLRDELKPKSVYQKLIHVQAFSQNLFHLRDIIPNMHYLVLNVYLLALQCLFFRNGSVVFPQ